MNKIALSTQNYTIGTYFAHVKTENRTTILKLIVK